MWLGWGKREMHMEFWCGNIFGNAHLEVRKVEWKIKKKNLMKMGGG
jgi:hypothetical protein